MVESTQQPPAPAPSDPAPVASDPDPVAPSDQAAPTNPAAPAEAPALVEAPPPTENHPAHTQLPLQVDPIQENPDEADSAYGTSIGGSTSNSLSSSITRYHWENGRRYHAYREGQYVMPNDDLEQDRLDLQHQIYRLCLDGWLYRAPIKSPQKVLDIGTGTGIWAIEFADEYPSAVVIGTDLSPIQPSYVPPNLSFYVDDFEQPWEFGGTATFDFIHWRGLCGSTAEWPKLYGQAMVNLKPGGWLEVQDYSVQVYGDDETFDRALWAKHGLTLLNDASVKFGKKLNVAHEHKGWMIDAGFVNVREEVYKVPIGPWTKDPKLKELGRFERANIVESVESHSMALFTRVLGYTSDEADILFANVKKEYKDPSLHM